MVKVTDQNVDMLSANLSYAGGRHQGVGTSGWAFNPRNHYEIHKALTWVAFVADKAWLDRSKVDKESIEMFVNMITSEHACFTTHAGIERGGEYKGDVHKDLSVKLHSFIAQVTQVEYPDKLYMINTPVDPMRPIIMNEFYKQGKFTDVFMRFRDKEAQSIAWGLDEEISELTIRLEEAKTKLESAGQHKGNHYWKGNDELNHLKQEKYLAGKKEIPIAVTKEEDGTRCYTIYGPDDKILHTFSSNPANNDKEYSWLYSEGCLIRGGENLLTCNLPSLAGLADFTWGLEDMSEIIGDTPYHQA